MGLESTGFEFLAKLIRGNCGFVVEVVLVSTLQVTLRNQKTFILSFKYIIKTLIVAKLCRTTWQKS